MKLWKKILIIIALIIAVILLAVLAVFLFWQPFGGYPDSSANEDYAKRAENYVDGEFANIGELPYGSGWSDKYYERSTGKGNVPTDTLPTKSPSFLSTSDSDGFSLTWFGHSTMIMQMSGLNILIDPVFSDTASPVSFTGPTRYSPLAINADTLPRIDICIISHDHYDHLDYKTIKDISEKVGLFIVPLGLESDLERWGVPAEKIHNMAWWEEYEVNGLTIGCTPAHHYSGRFVIDNRKTLWASWVFINDSLKVYESGDTGYSTHFEDIAEKYGAFDFTIIDCAQYAEAWHEVHMFPEEAIEAVKTLGSSVVMPIHWGAFSLSNHAWDDPVERITLAAEENGLTAVTPMLGETISFDSIDEYQSRWWREYQ